jgi:choline dehydrogenase
MPAALSIPMNMDKYNWGYHTEPEPALGGRRLHTPRGKVLGGSSSINGMVFARGNPQDFERWQEEGAAGWGYRHVLPYFRRAEHRAEGADEYRGDAGKLRCVAAPGESAASRVARGRPASWLPAHPDVNGFQQEGVGRLDMSVGDGQRCSAANAPTCAPPCAAII